MITMPENLTTENTFRIHAPSSDEIDVPRWIDDASDPYLHLQSQDEIRNYYQQNGYVVFRNLLPAELCDQARRAFTQEVKPYNGYLYRQTSSGGAEKNHFTDYGYLLNSILNIQDLNKDLFPDFKEAGLEVITNQNLYDAVCNVLGEPGIMVQSMYFEGNPTTWAHQDTYYLDSTKIGSMTAAWIAIEDIQPGAGRFFVYPGSHKVDMAKNGGNFDIAFNHMKYRELVLNVIEKYGLDCRAPALRKGDVLFWSAKTIHGSLETLQPQFSRNSMTAHFIPASTGFLQFQSRQRKLNLRRIGCFQVDCPKDQSRLKNRAIFHLETQFPQSFQLLKRLLIKLVTR